MQQLEILYINQHFLCLAGVNHVILGYINIDWYLTEYKIHFQIFVSKQDGYECPYTRDGCMIRPSIHLWRTLSSGWGEYLNKKRLLQWSRSSWDYENSPKRTIPINFKWSTRQTEATLRYFVGENPLSASTIFLYLLITLLITFFYLSRFQ